MLGADAENIYVRIRNNFNLVKKNLNIFLVPDKLTNFI